MARSELLLRRSLARAWRAGPSQLGCRAGLAGSDREFPRFTARSGTQRATSVGSPVRQADGPNGESSGYIFIATPTVPSGSFRRRADVLRIWLRGSPRADAPSSAGAGHASFNYPQIEDYPSNSG
jgi:hypothetical protein